MRREETLEVEGKEDASSSTWPGTEDKPRALVGLEEVVLMGALPLKLPAPPPLTSRIALAPKLMRRANGDEGGGLDASPLSSMALSSEPGEPEPLLDMLPCRCLAANGEVWFGEPERPIVETDMRRR